jgi:hypothetical protein
LIQTGPEERNLVFRFLGGMISQSTGLVAKAVTDYLYTVSITDSGLLFT